MFKNISIFKKSILSSNVYKTTSLRQHLDLYKFLSKNFAIYRSGMLRKEYEKEKAVYNKEKKEMMRRIQKEFWEEQTKVENEWLLNFIKIQKVKKRKDDAKLRSTIIRNSMACYQNIKTEIEYQQEFISKQKLWREQDTEILLEKHSLLTMLDREAEESWLTPENIDTKLSVEMNKILPPTILSHKDYYQRLNRYALLLEQGMDKEAEESKLNEAVLKFKNKNLAPLYDELKMIIKHLTYTEEHSTFELYTETINRIENYLAQNDNTDLTNHLKSNLTYLFKKLITLIRLENEKSDNKIEIIENQMKSLIMILVIWNKYVDIIYMPESEVNELISKDKSEGHDFKEVRTKSLEELVSERDPKMLKDYYFSRILDKKAKGTGLFVNNINGLFDDPILRREVEEKIKDDIPDYKKLSSNRLDSAEEEYPNVEGKFQDDSGDTDSSNFSDLKMEKKQLKKKENKKVEGKGKISEQKRKLLVNEDSEVFKEEEDEEAEINFDEFKNSKLSTNSKDKKQEIKEKVNLKNQVENVETNPKKKNRHLLEEYMLRNIKSECESSPISKLDVKKEYEMYKSNLLKDLGLNNEKELFEDIENELQEVELSKIIDINEYETELKKEQERMTLENEFRKSEREDFFKSSLFNSIVKYSKDIFDFKKPKFTTSLDIYDENLVKFLEFSVEESQIAYKSHNSSIVMEYLKEELSKLHEEELSPSNRLKRKHLIRLAEICGKMRITDSQNLKSVFDMFKHPNIKFDR